MVKIGETYRMAQPYGPGKVIAEVIEQSSRPAYYAMNMRAFDPGKEAYRNS